MNSNSIAPTARARSSRRPRPERSHRRAVAETLRCRNTIRPETTALDPLERGSVFALDPIRGGEDACARSDYRLRERPPRTIARSTNAKSHANGRERRRRSNRPGNSQAKGPQAGRELWKAGDRAVDDPCARLTEEVDRRPDSGVPAGKSFRCQDRGGFRRCARRARPEARHPSRESLK